MNREEAIVWMLRHPKEILRGEYRRVDGKRRLDYWMFFNGHIVTSHTDAGVYKASDAWLRRELVSFSVHHVTLTEWAGAACTVTDCIGPFLRLPRDFIGRRVRVAATPVTVMSGKDAMIWMLKHTGWMVRSMSQAHGKSNYDEYFFSNKHQGFRGRNGGRARSYAVDAASLMTQGFTVSDTWKDVLTTTSDASGPYVRLPAYYEEQEMRVHVTLVQGQEAA